MSVRAAFSPGWADKGVSLWVEGTAVSVFTLHQNLGIVAVP